MYVLYRGEIEGGKSENKETIKEVLAVVLMNENGG